MSRNSEVPQRELTTPIAELLNEAEACCRWLLPLFLEQSHEPACKDLVGQTVTNLVKFFEGWERPPQGRVSQRVQKCLSAALEAENRDNQRAELCTLLVQNATILYPYHGELRSFLYELIRTSGGP